MIFIDRSIPEGVADAVKSVHDDILYFEDVWEMHWIKGREWIPVVVQENG